MPSFLWQKTSKGLLERMQALSDLPRSRAFQRHREAIGRLVVDGNRQGLLAGTDKMGKPLARLKSTRKGKYKGATGPPLVPFGGERLLHETDLADVARVF